MALLAYVLTKKESPEKSHESAEFVKNKFSRQKLARDRNPLGVVGKANRSSLGTGIR